MCRLPGFTEKKAPKEFGRRLEKLVALRTLGDTPDPELSRWLETLPSDTRKRLVKNGLLDARTAANSNPLAEHLADFHSSLLHKGDSNDHADLVTGRVRRTCEGCKFKQFAVFNPSKVQRFLSEMRNNGDGISAQTSNFYLQVIKQFARWMMRGGRASESLLGHLTGVNVKLDRRHDRWNLTASELSYLLKTTAAGPVRHRLNGRARAMLYRAAMEKACSETNCGR